MWQVTGLELQAATRGLAVVYPDAGAGGWGDDTFATPDRPRGDEDVVYLDALVDSVQHDPGVAEGPVALVGFSNGASMALRYAGARPDRTSAVVSVAGQLPRDPAVRPTGRVPLLEVYGTTDPIRPFTTGILASPDRAPGSPTPTLSTPDTIAAFTALADGATEDRAGPDLDVDPADGTLVRTTCWSDDTGTVAVLIAVEGGGHTWPGAREPFGEGDTYGPTSREVDATAEAVAFVAPDGEGSAATRLGRSRACS